LARDFRVIAALQQQISDLLISFSKADTVNIHSLSSCVNDASSPVTAPHMTAQCPNRQGVLQNT
jgi:hypothetical protein